MSGQYKLRKSYGRRNCVKVGFNQSTVRKLSEVPILNLDKISQNLELPNFMCESHISFEDLRQLFIK